MINSALLNVWLKLIGKMNSSLKLIPKGNEFFSMVEASCHFDFIHFPGTSITLVRLTFSRSSH